MVDETLPRALQLHRSGQSAEAELLCRTMLSTDQGHVDARWVLGLICQDQGRYAEALNCYQQAWLLDPMRAELPNNLGNVLASLGRHDEAEVVLRQAVLLRPDYLSAWQNLGNVLMRRGLPHEAIVCWERVVQLDPRRVDVWHALGRLYEDLQRYDDAERSFRLAAELQPNVANRFNHWGIALRVLGRFDEAVQVFERALLIDPKFAEAHANLAGVFQSRGDHLAALDHFRLAVNLKGELPSLRMPLALAELEQANVRAFREHIEHMQRTVPNDLHRVLLATSLPPVYESRDEMLAYRRQFIAGVHRLVEDGVCIDTTQTLIPRCPFYLAYHGENERVLQEQQARLFTADEVTPIRSSSKRMRVGFLSQYFWNHTIGRLNLGVVRRLDRQRFEVFVIGGSRPGDPIERGYRSAADHYLPLPPTPRQARELVRSLGLDVLYFTDVGMDPLTYTLSFCRMAPVQCATWGHPLTTGSPTIDYFISSTLLETPDAQQHYREQLVSLPHLAVVYERPSPPASIRSRESFGIAPAGRMYACPQSIFKIHPDFDDVLAAILRRDPSGEVFLLAGPHASWTDRVRRRFEQTMSDVASRIHFLPALNHQDFLSLNLVADVLLDTLHFGGGNTSFEAFALGRPIVTLPSPYLRGRITTGLYRQMGIADLVANSPAEYVELAVRLANDRDYREVMRRQVQSRADVLFDNGTGVRDLEGFFESLRARNPP